MLQGGVKVLITGPWLESSSEYSCLFDHISVPAALIQPGVLRCYCPGNTPVCHILCLTIISSLYIKERLLLQCTKKNIRDDGGSAPLNAVRSGGLTMSTLRIVFWDGRVSET